MDETNQSNASGTGASRNKKLPFTQMERELIEALVMERPIIEDKRTTAKNIELKRLAWEELTVAFNTQPYVSRRNSQQLKRCWENMKSLRKKELSQESYYYNMSHGGGGPPPCRVPQGGSPGTDNEVDASCPFISISVPGVPDSNSAEISGNQEVQVKMEIMSDEEFEADKSVLDDSKKNTLKRKIEDVSLTPNNSQGITVNRDNGQISNQNDIISQQTKKNEISNIPRGAGKKKFMSEIGARIKRCSLNIQQDQELHELRLLREKVLIQREKNQLDFEEEMHKLELEKIKLEIDVLRKKI